MSNKPKDSNKDWGQENDENCGVIKTIFGSVTGAVVYHTFPVKWEMPIIEQVFLPAHAAPSSVLLHTSCDVISKREGLSNHVVVNVSGFIIPPSSGLLTTITARVTDEATPFPPPVTVTTSTQTDGTFSTPVDIPHTDETVSTIEIVTRVDGARGDARCEVVLEN